ncbi:MAG: hypothetical protein LBS65_04905 [Desulfovibrio sp.]|jgi:hypothetical protein|nr:hypothetical protein [Desulfovibrio sp.]
MKRVTRSARICAQVLAAKQAQAGFARRKRTVSSVIALVPDCKNSEHIFYGYFCRIVGGKRGFPPTYAAYGGAKPFGFCSVYFYK